MSKEERKNSQVINVNINIEAIAAARRNADNLEGLALEVPTVNPKNLTLDTEIYTLKSTPVNDKVKGKKKEFAPKVVGIKSFIINALNNTSKEGCITINGVFDVPKSGNRVVKLEECMFDNEDDARAVARVLTEIELEKADEMFKEAKEAVDYLKKQLEDDRF